MTPTDLETLRSVLDLIDGLSAKYGIDLDDEDRATAQAARGRWCDQSYPSLALADNIPKLHRSLVYAYFNLRVSEKMEVARLLGITVDGHLSNLDAGKAFLVAVRDAGKLADLQTFMASKQ